MTVLYLLDTNVLLAYMRRGFLGAYIEATYEISTVIPVSIISIITEAEIRVIAAENGWGAFKIKMLQQTLDYFNTIPIPFENIMDAYLAVEASNRRQGRTMDKNDIWIAATAHVTGARLLTSDRDFDHLHGTLLERDWIDPTSRL